MEAAGVSTAFSHDHHEPARRLVELAQQRLELLETLVELSRHQPELVEQRQLEPLLQLTLAKQAKIDQFSLIQQQLRPFCTQPLEPQQWPSPELRQRCQELLERGQSLLAQLMQQDQQSLEGLQLQRDWLAGQLQVHSGGQEALAAYGLQQTLGCENPGGLSCEG
jgi:hypothetical protein